MMSAKPKKPGYFDDYSEVGKSLRAAGVDCDSELGISLHNEVCELARRVRDDQRERSAYGARCISMDVARKMMRKEIVALIRGALLDPRRESNDDGPSQAEDDLISSFGAPESDGEDR